MAFLQSRFVLVSVAPYSQALFGLDTLVLSCFEAGDQKDEAEPGGTNHRGWCSAASRPAVSQCWGQEAIDWVVDGVELGTRFSLRTLLTQAIPWYDSMIRSDHSIRSWLPCSLQMALGCSVGSGLV